MEEAAIFVQTVILIEQILCKNHICPRVSIKDRKSQFKFIVEVVEDKIFDKFCAEAAED